MAGVEDTQRVRVYGLLPVAQGAGRATFTVNWPARSASRLIPAAANSIVVKVTKADGTPLSEQRMARPAEGGTTTANFADLPVGEVIAQVSAYPNADGTGVAQASATASVTIEGGKTATLSLTLDSTIDHLEVSAPAGTLVNGAPVTLLGFPIQLTAVAKSGSGEIVLTSPSKVVWTSSAPLIAATDATGKVSGVVPGTAVITATETESGKSASLTVTVKAFAAAASYYVSATTNDIVVDPVTSTVYGSIPSSVGANGNSLCTINAYTPLSPTGPPVFVGNEPGKLGISDDGKYVYVGLRNAPNVVRYNAITRTADLEFPLIAGQNSGSNVGPFYAEDIQVVPGSPNSVVVSRQNKTSSPRHEGVLVYDNGVPRAQATGSHSGANVITFGTTPTRLYGYNTDSSAWEFYRFTISADGLTINDIYYSSSPAFGDLLSGFNLDIVFDSGRLYASSGRIIDPETRKVITTLPVNTVSGLSSPGGLVRPAGDLNRVFFLTRESGPSGTVNTVRAFDTRTFQEVGSLPIPDALGFPSSLQRWGPKGLVFRTATRVFFITNAPGT